MPLIQRKSKKAFEKNVSKEMQDGKPQKQALAIAFQVQRKNKRKKMAGGGKVGGWTKEDKDKFSKGAQESAVGSVGEAWKNLKSGLGFGDDKEESKRDSRRNMAEGGIAISANDEKRPMPDNVYGDKDETSRNRGKKPLKNSDWDDNSTVTQAQKPSPTKLSQPKLMGSDSFSARNKAMRDEENNLEESLHPESDRAQPQQRYNEDGANRQGPKVSDMERQHNNKRAAYEASVERQYAQDMAAAEMKKTQSLAMGGPVMEPEDHDMERMERDDEMDMQSRLSPGRHGEQPKSELDELEADSFGNPVPDMEREHSNGRKPYARGGEISPQDEIDDEHHASVAAAIMSKRKKMADGGQVDLEEHSEEARNLEDDLSFEALEKEQYDDSQLGPQPKDSNEHSDELLDEDEHNKGMIGAIRKKMKSKRA